MNTDTKRYYAALGVDPAASDEAIRGAFRRRAKQLHPDAQSGNATAFILLKRAYDTLIDPDHRAAYDQACQPPPRPSQPRTPQSAARPAKPYRTQPYQRTSPSPPRSPSSRRGGVGFVRYAIAFIIMAALSLGGVQAMISLTGAPPSIQTRTAAHTDAGTDTPSAPATEPSTAPGSSKSGFWDASPGKKSP